MSPAPQRQHPARTARPEAGDATPVAHPAALPRAGPARALSPEDLRSAFHNAPIGMAVVTPHGVITACNAALGELLHRDPDDLLGGTFFDVTHVDDLESAQASCALMQDGSTAVLRHECRFVPADGALVWVLISTSRVPERNHRPAHLIMHVEDITERKNLEAELQHRALHDPLTGLANRHLLLDRLDDVLRSSGRHARPAHLFYLDLDGFKAVNDQHGHAAGDELLVQLAGRLTTLLGPDDLAARLGGDEFAVLCTGRTAGQPATTGRALHAAAAHPFTIGPHTVTLSAAVGHVLVPTASSDGAGRYLQEADRRMYAGKRRARR